MSKSAKSHPWPETLQRSLRELDIKRKGPARIEVEIHVAPVVASLIPEIRTLTEASPSTIRRLSALIDRKLCKSAGPIHWAQRLTVESIEAVGDLFLELVKRHVLRSRQSKSGRAGSHSFANSRLTVLSSLARDSGDPRSWLAVAEFARRASKEVRAEVVAGGDSYSMNLRTALMSLLADALEGGRISEAERVTSVSRANDRLAGVLEAELGNLAQKLVALPPISQEWLQRRDNSIASEIFAHTEPSESHSLRQTAALLLFLWDHAEESPLIREAFQRLSLICATDFQLSLSGEVGAVEKYDSRLHDAIDAEGAMVRITRPRVESQAPSNVRVVIRALAERMT